MAGTADAPSGGKRGGGVGSLPWPAGHGEVDGGARRRRSTRDRDRAGTLPAPVWDPMHPVAGGAHPVAGGAAEGAYVSAVRAWKATGAREAVGRRPALVGRDAEIAGLTDLVARERVVTLVGPGGVGKSRIAAELARRAELAEGSVTVALERVAHESLVAGALADALGSHDVFLDRRRRLGELGDREVMVVLDGCEHVLEALRPLVESLLAGGSRLRLLATSQEPLRVGGERVVAIGPLAVPGRGHPTVEEIAGCPAAQLFLASVRSAAPDAAFDVVLDDTTAPAVSSICRQLVGTPLALEIAASLVPTLGIGELARELEAPASPISDGGDLDGVAPSISATERALVRSTSLLDPPERRILDHLAVFAGGADARVLGRAAVEAGDLGSRAEVLRGLAGLVDRSLATVDVVEGLGRYDLPGAVRRHVRRRLEREGRWVPLARRHLAWCLDEVAGAEATLVGGPRQRVRLEHLAREQDNLRAALAFALGVGDVQAGGQLAVDLWRFWELRGQLGEGRSWLEAILASGGGTADLRTHLLDGLGMLAWRQGDRSAAQAALDEAVRSATVVGDRRTAARVTNHLGLVAMFAGELASARALFEKSHGELDGLDAPGEAAQVRANLALVAVQEGRCEEAVGLLDGALRVQVAVGDHHGQAISRLHRGIARYFLGDLAAVGPDALAAARSFLELGDERSLAFSLLLLAATVGAAHPALALELAGQSGAIRARVGFEVPVGWDEHIEAALAPARAAAGPQAAALLRRGGSAAPDDLVARAAAGISGRATEPVEEGSAVEVDALASVEVLGGFEVRLGDRVVHLERQPGLLVKQLAASRSAVHVEQVIDTLWPDATAWRGRRRLRNVLSRLHRGAGPLVVRDGELLRFGPGVALDVAVFEHAVDAALDAFTKTGDARAARRLAEAADRLYAGDLLPEELYEPWAAEARERLRRRRLRLLETWAKAAIADGDAVEAEACLRAAIEVDPIDEARHVELARLLVGSGRPAAAASVLSQARAMATGLGVPVSPAVAALEAALGSARAAEPVARAPAVSLSL